MNMGSTFHSFANIAEIVTRMEEKKALSGFMIPEFDDQINILYSISERTAFNCVSIMFKEKLNHVEKCGVHFHSMRILDEDIDRIPRTDILESISRYVVLLPYIKENHPNRFQYTIIGDDYNVLRSDAYIGPPQYSI